MRKRGKLDSYHISVSRNRPFKYLAEITVEPTLAAVPGEHRQVSGAAGDRRVQGDVARIGAARRNGNRSWTMSAYGRDQPSRQTELE